MKNAHIFYSGRVQGVGFRYTARHIAANSNLTGWVKNLYDGRVEIMCQGQESDIKNFVSILDEEFSSYVKDKKINWSEVSGKFNSFNITF